MNKTKIMIHRRQINFTRNIIIGLIMMIILLTIIILLTSCKDNPVINLHPPVNPFNGYYVMHSQDPLPGSATIYIRQNGSIQNGIKIRFAPGEDPILSLIWMDGIVNGAGQFCGIFWNDSGSGRITGIFTRSGGSGQYNIAFSDSFYYGFWCAARLPD